MLFQSLLAQSFSVGLSEEFKSSPIPSFPTVRAASTHDGARRQMRLGNVEFALKDAPRGKVNVKFE